MSKCPICNKELVKNYEHACQYGVEESSYECKGHYAEVFAYGSTEIHVGDFITGFHYSDPTERRERLSKLIQVIADAYKEGVPIEVEFDGPYNEAKDDAKDDAPPPDLTSKNFVLGFDEGGIPPGGAL